MVPQRENPKLSGARGLLRDESEQLLFGFAQNIGMATSVVAKLWGCLDGTWTCLDLSFHSLILEVDSELVQMSIYE